MTQYLRIPLTVLGALLLLSRAAIPPASLADESTIDLTALNVEELMQVKVDTVYGASKYQQKITEAPASVWILTANEIKQFGYRTLSDVLRSVPGFWTTYDRNYDYAGIRGFIRPGDYNTRLLLLVDGVRINDSNYDMAPIGTDFVLDLDLVDRVEVIRGPSFSLYGSNALLAVVNVISKRGRDLKGLEASGEVGSFETYKGRLSYGNRFSNGLEMLLSGTIYDSNGQDLYFSEFADPATNDGKAVNRDGAHFGSAFGKLAFRDFSLEGVYIKRKKDVPTAPYETVFNDPHTETADERLFIDAKYNHTFTNQLDLMVWASYNQYDYDGRWPYDWADPGAPPHIITAQEGSRNAWWSGEVQVTKELFEKHTLVGGAEFRNNVRQDLWYRDLSAQLDLKGDSRNWALYLQDDFRILTNLILNAGVRYDHFDTFGGTVNPRAALIYNPLENTTLKFLYGTAFRAPNAYELYYDDGVIFKPNPTLNEERITSYEAILEQRLGKYFQANVHGFYYKLKDLISQITDPNDGFLVFQNLDKVKAEGVEAELIGKWRGGLEEGISYTFQHATDERTGQTLVNSPRHLLKGNLIYPLLKNKLFAGAELQYLTKRKTLAGKSVGGFLITNLTLFSQKIIPGLEVSGSIYNLFNRHYADPGGGEHLQDTIEQDGRTFRIKNTYRF